MNAPDKLIPVRRVTEILGISRSSLYRLLESASFPSPFVSAVDRSDGGRPRFWLGSRTCPRRTYDLTHIGMGFPAFAPAAPVPGLSASGFAIPSPQPIKESPAGVRAGKRRRLGVNRRRDANKLGRCCV